MKKLLRDLKVGAESVLREKKLFLPFFITAFIIESLFMSLVSVGWSIERYYFSSISDEYPYEYIVEGMDNDSYVAFHHMLNTLNPVEGQIARTLTYEKYDTAVGQYYRAYVTLNKMNFKAKTHFMQSVEYARANGNQAFSLIESPSLVRNTYVADIRTVTVTLWVAVFLISAYMLVCVYRVRISHYRFMYGVYMTCGANYKRLVSGAICEMLAVFAVSLIPAFLFSVVVSMIIFSSSPMHVSFLSPVLPVAILSSVGVILAAVGVPMRLVASDMPINLITKGGTSEYVISPRRSAKLFGKSFPYFYELLGIKRFAKYYIILLSMCVLLNSLFITGIYAGNLSDEIINSAGETFKVECRDGFSDDSLIEMAGIRGVEKVLWDNSFLGMQKLSYISMDRDMNLSESFYTVDYSTNRCASFAVDYKCMDSILIKTLIDSGMAVYEGDPYAILDDGAYNVIISRDIQNVDRFDIKVGDTITVNYVDDEYEPYITDPYVDERVLLSAILDERYEGIANYFEIDLKVCAIVDYAAPEGTLTVGLSPALYELIGGESARVSLDIYTNDGITLEEEGALVDSLSRVASFFGGWKVERSYNSLKNKLSSDTYILGLFIIVALFVLVGVPVLWLFSQRVFYEKRESEIELIRCIGAKENQLRALYISDGAFLALIAFVFTLIFSALISFILYVLATLILPFFGFRGVWKLHFELSPLSLLVSAGVCALCGFVASLSAYLKGNRERLKKEREYHAKRAVGENNAEQEGTEE